jgi:tetratricopeptide (TPR) repeat protein
MAQRVITVIGLLLLCWLATSAQTAPAAPPSFSAEQYLQTGNQYMREQQYDKAVDAYKQAIHLDPNLAAAYHALGSVYVNMGRAGDALVPLQTAVRLDPNNSLIHLNLGITLAILHRGEDALTEMNEAKRLNPNDARIANEQGNVLHNLLGRLNDALAAYQEARQLSPNDPVIQHNIGLTLLQLGQVADAIEPLQTAVRLAPKYRDARYLLSDAYSRSGRYNEAAESWGKFLEIVPNGPEALTKQAWAYLYLGEHGREAATDARQYLSAHGWHTEISAYMAVIANLGYREAGQDEEARLILEEATKQAETGSWPYQIVRYLKGELGVDELLRLATDNDKKTEAHAYTGLDLRIKGQTDEARAHYQWVRAYGNKRFYEYPLAIAELKRLGK